MRRLVYIMLLSASLSAHAQEPWTVDQCIEYAVIHNLDVKMQCIALDDYRTEKVRATWAFSPSLEGSAGGRYNFGRAIDPETNTYTNVSTFYNANGISAHIPIFDGFQRYHALRAAKADLLKGKSQLDAQKDQTAQRVLEGCLQVMYYQGSVDISTRKLAESASLLRRTRIMAEVGQKGEADIAQIQATYASDDYELVRQQSLYEKALLSLKQQMNFPVDEPLTLVSPEEPAVSGDLLTDSGEEIFGQAETFNPAIRQAAYGLLSARYAYLSSKGDLYPSISLGAGISTTYFKQLNAVNTSGFGAQFRHNAGEYVYATLSIPLFNRMNTLAHIRRSRNNVRRAQEELDYRRNELKRLIKETLAERENSRKETEKLRAKVESDSMAARIMTRKYEEGLATPIEVQTQAVALLQSKVLLLQSRLSYIYKNRMLQYFKGIPLWTE